MASFTFLLGRSGGDTPARSETETTSASAPPETYLSHASIAPGDPDPPQEVQDAIKKHFRRFQKLEYVKPYRVDDLPDPNDVYGAD